MRSEFFSVLPVGCAVIFASHACSDGFIFASSPQHICEGIAQSQSNRRKVEQAELEALLLEAEQVKRKQDEKEAELEAAAEIVDEMFLAEVKVIGKC